MNLSNLLIAARSVHIASTVALAGSIFFAAIVVSPVYRADHTAPCFDIWWRHLAWIEWVSLGVSVLSGAGWLLLLAADISNQSLQHDLSASVIWKLLTRTRFGFDWIARFGIAILLAAGLVVISRRRLPASRGHDQVLTVLAAAFCGSLAWAGHASGTPGNLGNIHRAADVAHLLAAGAWLGGLVPLASLLAKVRHVSELAFATKVTRRFSTLGLIAVGTILLTGVMNSYILVGSIAALTDTDYGRLLLVKLSLFGVMLSIAAVNRFRITPGLSNSRSGAIAARQLQRNSLVEAGFGLAILGIVGALGALPPGSHVHMM